VLAALAGAGALPLAQTFGSWLDPYRGTAQKLMAAAQENDFAWQRLAELTDTYGARPAWSGCSRRPSTWITTDCAAATRSCRARRSPTVR